MGVQETLNYWKQLPHVLKYFRAEEDPEARLPKSFIEGFLQVHMFRLCRRRNSSLMINRLVAERASLAPPCTYHTHSSRSRERKPQSTSLRHFLVRLFVSVRISSVELVPRYRELVFHDVTHGCEITKAFAQHVVHANVVCHLSASVCRCGAEVYRACLTPCLYS